ncbi:hypothetical protein KR018_008913 [Drosophila ironensis]|nr:hypothetical protein KR018_008913 [Drosophila ironensis]
MDFNYMLDQTLEESLETAQFLQDLRKEIPNAEYEKLCNGSDVLEDYRKTMETQAEEFVQLRTKHRQLLKAMDEEGRKGSDLEGFNRDWKSRSATIEGQKNNVKQTLEYKRLQRQIQDAFAPGATEIEPRGSSDTGAPIDLDDDDVVVQGNVAVFSVYDPWTKTLMRNPVRNKKCGHIYDRDSVMATIKDNLSISCPYMGCLNSAYIHPADLVEDSEAREKILQHIRNEVEDSDSDGDE